MNDAMKEIQNLKIEGGRIDKDCFLDNDCSYMKFFLRRLFTGETVCEYIERMNELVENVFPLELAKDVVADCNTFLASKSFDEILEYIRNEKIKTNIDTIEFNALLAEFIDSQYIMYSRYHEVSRVIFECVVRANADKYAGIAPFYISHYRVDFNALYLNFIKNVIPSDDILLITKHAFEFGFSIQSIYAAIASVKEENVNMIKKAVATDNANKKNEQENESIKFILKKYVRPAWACGCKLLHVQMAKLIVAGFHDGIRFNRLKSVLKDVVEKEFKNQNLRFGDPQAKKMVTICPCDETESAGCPIFITKNSEGKFYNLKNIQSEYDKSLNIEFNSREEAEKDSKKKK